MTDEKIRERIEQWHKEDFKSELKTAFEATVTLAMFLATATLISSAIEFFYYMGKLDGLW